MFAKLLLVILVMAATACVLLVNRQQRIDTAHRMARVHQQVLSQQQQLWTLRRDIAIESQPDRIREAVDEIGGIWSPIVLAGREPL